MLLSRFLTPSIFSQIDVNGSSMERNVSRDGGKSEKERGDVRKPRNFIIRRQASDTTSFVNFF